MPADPVDGQTFTFNVEQTNASTNSAGVVITIVDDQGNAVSTALAGDVFKYSESNTRWERVYRDIDTDTDTVIWQGDFALRTAYPEGSIVEHSTGVYIYVNAVDATNTTSPDQDTTNAKRIDGLLGSDIINASGGTPGQITFTRRNGTTFSVMVGGDGSSAAPELDFFYNGENFAYDNTGTVVMCQR